jgi:predicted nucleotidyltransferase/DNA-binding HxlR family transcriptional regulator
MKTLVHHLLGEIRTAVLAALLLRPEQRLHVRELVRLTGASPGALHRELTSLVDQGVLTRQQVGRQVFYQANEACPVLPELTGLIRKTAGLADVLRAALSPLSERIDGAFVYGSMAKDTVHAHSDVDIMIVGAIGFAEAVLALSPAQLALRREVNPMVLSREQFLFKRGDQDGFVAGVWKDPKVWVMGSMDELG